MTDSTFLIGAGSCLGRTCLQWSADGELTAFDLHLVLDRLAQVDQAGTALYQGRLNREACPTGS